MSQSAEFVSNFRSASVEAIKILTTLQALSTQAALLGYPGNFSPDAFTDANSGQTHESIAAGLAVFSNVLTALQANNNAGITAIYNSAA